MAIVTILSSVVLFSISRYINSGKDSNVAGNLSVLVPAGEIYYNNNNESYEGFCDSESAKNAFSQMPQNTKIYCHVSAEGDQWAACAIKFANSENAFCVDSRGVKRDIAASLCDLTIEECK